jgi:hypothetical protein
MLLRRALPDAHQKSARPFPIYEMGSKKMADLDMARTLEPAYFSRD